jgi:hypothetical protein
MLSDPQMESRYQQRQSKRLVLCPHVGHACLHHQVCWCVRPSSVGILKQQSLLRPPLQSSVQSSWLQIKRSGIDFRRYQIFWEVVRLELGPLSLVSTIEELLDRKSIGSGLESREYGRKNVRQNFEKLTLGVGFRNRFDVNNKNK